MSLQYWRLAIQCARAYSAWKRKGRLETGIILLCLSCISASIVNLFSEGQSCGIKGVVAHIKAIALVPPASADTSTHLPSIVSRQTLFV
jgi:hypothetical protein